LIRVNHLTGTTVWAVNRPLPNTGAEALAASGNKVYGWKGYINTDKLLTAWNMETGAELYSIALPGDGDQEIPHIVGPDGTIYLKRDGGLLYAIQDNGSGFSIRWTHGTTGAQTYSQWGVGLDGSLYVPDGISIVRLDAATGNELYRSPALITTSATLNARITVGANWTLYVCNGGYADGAVYALSPDLQILWSDPIYAITYGGPAMGMGGTLAVSGGSDILKVYQTAQTNLTVTLQPISTPIVIPANGGSFNFNATVQRIQAPQAAFWIWARDRHPDGSYTPNLLGPVQINPPVGVTVTRQRTQVVPASWPAGVHYYVGYAHTSISYPATDADSFSWTKSVTSDGGPTLWEAINYGESFPGEAAFSPHTSAFSKASPNPFNATTAISYDLLTASHVRLSVYDTAGRLVATLVDNWRGAGSHEVTFDGSAFASGIYVYRLDISASGTTPTTVSGKMLLLK
jgi:hypothetical protein